jgi:hypothetical protein
LSDLNLVKGRAKIQDADNKSVDKKRSQEIKEKGKNSSA